MAKTPRGWTGARTPSAIKRVRQAERRAGHQPTAHAARPRRTSPTPSRSAPARHEGDPAQALAEAMSALDRAAKVGVIHPNNAARRKSRLALKLNALQAGDSRPGDAHATKTTGTAAAVKAARTRIATAKATKAKGPQTAAGKARAALSKTARSGSRSGVGGARAEGRSPRPRPRPPAKAAAAKAAPRRPPAKAARPRSQRPRPAAPRPRPRPRRRRRPRPPAKARQGPAKAAKPRPRPRPRRRPPPRSRPARQVRSPGSARPPDLALSIRRQRGGSASPSQGARPRVDRPRRRHRLVRAALRGVRARRLRHLVGGPGAEPVPRASGCGRRRRRHPAGRIVVGCGYGDDAELLAGRGPGRDRLRHRAHGDRPLPEPASPAPGGVRGRRRAWSRRPSGSAPSTSSSRPTPSRSCPASCAPAARAASASWSRRAAALLVVARSRRPEDPEGLMPWPLTRAELDEFAVPGLELAHLDEIVEPGDPPVPRFVAEFTAAHADAPRRSPAAAARARLRKRLALSLEATQPDRTRGPPVRTSRLVSSIRSQPASRASSQARSTSRRPIDRPRQASSTTRLISRAVGWVGVDQPGDVQRWPARRPGPVRRRRLRRSTSLGVQPSEPGSHLLDGRPRSADHELTYQLGHLAPRRFGRVPDLDPMPER